MVFIIILRLLFTIYKYIFINNILFHFRYNYHISLSDSLSIRFFFLIF